MGPASLEVDCEENGEYDQVNKHHPTPGVGGTGKLATMPQFYIRVDFTFSWPSHWPWLVGTFAASSSSLPSVPACEQHALSLLSAMGDKEREKERKEGEGGNKNQAH